jgi:chitodextrinase
VAPVAVTPPGGATVFLDSPDIAVDDQGNAFAVWQRNVSGPDTFSAQVAGFDPVPPVITAAAVPAAATAGQAVAMSAAATDRMTASPQFEFDFGDGSSATGAAVQHSYGAAGTYTVLVTATDDAGNRSGTTRVIQVAPAPATIAATGTPGTTTGPNRVLAVAAGSWDRLRNGRTRMKSLVVDELAGPEVVELSCTGRNKGCRKSANRTVRKHDRKVDFTKYVKGMTLRPKAQLTVSVTRPGYVARVITYTMVNGRDPKKSTRCLPPGAKKLGAC